MGGTGFFFFLLYLLRYGFSCSPPAAMLSPSQLASLLGRLGRGKRKTLTKAERARRARRLAEARKKRWT